MSEFEEQDLIQENTLDMSTDTPPVDPEQTKAQDFDQQQWAYTYKGKQYFPTDRNHLINLAQKGHAFESRMEALNKQKADLDGQAEMYGQYKELDQLFQSNPDFQKAVIDLRQQHLGQNQQQQAPGIDPAMQAKLDEFERWKNSEVQRREDEKVQKQIEDMKKQFPDHDWNNDDGSGTLTQKIIQHALDNGIDNLISAYKDFHFDTLAVQAKAEALKQSAAQKQKQSKAGIVQSGTPTAKVDGNTFDPKKLDYNSLQEMAIEELS